MYKLPKVTPNPQTPQNSLLDTSLQSREKISCSTARTLIQASLSRKPWQATLPSPLTGRNLHNKEEPQTSSIQKGHPKNSNLNKMKRHRNIQQVKEHNKCPPRQIKEEELGSLTEKEFRIMIVKMIQNLENKRTHLPTQVRCKKRTFDPWVEKIPWRRAQEPTPEFLPGESHGKRSLVGYSPLVRTELDVSEAT